MRLTIRDLEQRIVLDAAGATQDESANLSEPAASTDVVVVDGNVADAEGVAAALEATGAEVHVLDPSRDGIDQVSDLLAGRSGVETLRIVSHGGEGHFLLGTSSVWKSPKLVPEKQPKLGP